MTQRSLSHCPAHLPQREFMLSSSPAAAPEHLDSAVPSVPPAHYPNREVNLSHRAFFRARSA